ncbi:hypothetical protein Cs7R123_25110 [Catellatospora sp. TT07R-123]|uniref:hypothetical protein n=1 Tax=Catellatospora sp. TT07R-123 TaxID=2733863 RepID=UPI001B121B82|nr:hypothetical protein [Catellatospora sp. TT07R-123]GHJ45169.1 hypothetical protein Cs7R123_25110 [Catellatospora sp. TT07R-123]
MSDLKELLDGIAAQAPRYDVLDGIRARRRRRTLRLRVAGSGAGAAAFAAVAVLLAVHLGVHPKPDPATPTPSASATSSPAPKPVLSTCEVRQLPVPRGYPPKSVLTAGDPTGRFLAGRAYPGDGRPRLLIWDDGRVRAIREPGADAGFEAIAADGTAVVTAFEGDTKAAWLYRDGRMTRLAGADPIIAAVNTAGVIVGMSGGRPVVWRPPYGAPQPLSTAGGVPVDPTSIAEDGTIAGVLRDSAVGPVREPNEDLPTAHDQAVLLLPDGTERVLELPEEIDDRPLKGVRGVQLGDGFVTALLYAGSSTDTVVRLARWELGTFQLRLQRMPHGGNLLGADGWTVGAEGLGNVLVSPSGTVALPNLPGASDDPYDRPNFRAISADGRTVGGYVTMPGEGVLVVAVRWRCG